MPVFHKDLIAPGAIHPAAYVGATDPALDPANSVARDKCWIDTSVGPPYALKIRNALNTDWVNVGSTGTVTDGVLELPTDCVEFPQHAEICNDTPDELHYTMDTTAGSPKVHRQTVDAYVLPSGHEIQVTSVSGGPGTAPTLLATTPGTPTLLAAGAYTWAYAFVYADLTTSGLSPTATVTIADSQAISATATAALPTGGLGYIWYCSAYVGYPDEVLADAPAGYWKLDGTGADSSGHGMFATSGGSGITTVPALYALGHAVHLDGSGGAYYTIAPTTSLPLVPPYTIEGWAYQVDGDTITFLAYCGDDGLTGLNKFMFQQSPDSYTTLDGYSVSAGDWTIFNNWDFGGFDLAANIVDIGALGGRWNHCAVTNDGTSISLYWQGTLLRTRDGGLPDPGHFDHTLAAIGGNPSLSGMTEVVGGLGSGTLCHVAVYPTDLSGARLLWHYLSGTTVPGLGQSPGDYSFSTTKTIRQIYAGDAPSGGVQGLVARDPAGNLLWTHEGQVFTVFSNGTELISFGEAS